MNQIMLLLNKMCKSLFSFGMIAHMVLLFSVNFFQTLDLINFSLTSHPQKRTVLIGTKLIVHCRQCYFLQL